MENEKKFTGPAYEFEAKMPLKQAIPLGLQHVLAMFVGNLTPLLIITGACGITGGNDLAQLQIELLQNAMLVAGLITLLQLFSVGPVGGKVPIIMGTSSGFIGVFNSVAATMGGGILAYGAIMGASIIGGLFESVLGCFLKPLRRFFPSVVTGTVVLSIGLSLIGVGVNSFGGGSSAQDFGSMENMLLAIFVLIVILAVKHGTKGYLSSSSILVGIIAGYAVAFIMGLVLPHTGIAADGTEYTKAWVLNWDKVAQASWISIPPIVPVKIVFDMRAILPVLIMFIVTAVETVGDISGVVEGGMDREATDKELSGGVICDGLGSSIAALFGVLTAAAQDLIVKTDATKIEAKVIEITTEAVRYKRFSNPDGPTYVLPVKDIHYIQYANGEKEYYTKTIPATPLTPAAPAEPAQSAPAVTPAAEPAPQTPAGRYVLKQYEIGELYDQNGIRGVICQLSDDGMHGLVVSLDEIYLHWSEFRKPDLRVVGADSRTDGEENMAKVAQYIAANNLSWADFPAFEWCRKKGEGWYLPAIDEMLTIGHNYNGGTRVQNNRQARNKFNDALKDAGGKRMDRLVYYFTSTEMDEKNAYTTHMGIEPPYVIEIPKYNKFLVRAVHKF